MRKLAVSALALAFAASQSLAYADQGCLGCNVSDTGDFNSQLVGRTVFIEGGVDAWATVEGIDVYSGRVYVRTSDGRRGWVSASNTYTRASRDERVGAGAAGVIVGAAILACLLGACSNDSSPSRQSSSSGRASNRDYDYGGRPSYSPPPPPPAPPAPCTTGLYGNCHGGPLYGHPEGN
jgi:hypothetical protein